jgi:hypothetical protein
LSPSIDLCHFNIWQAGFCQNFSHFFWGENRVFSFTRPPGRKYRRYEASENRFFDGKMSKTYDFCGLLMKNRGEEAVKRRG